MASNTTTSAEDGPHGLLLGPFRCQLLGRDAMRELRASDDFADWPEPMRRADELVIVFGCTDEAGRRWSYFVDGAAFRAATADGFGDDAHPTDLSELVLGHKAGWPEDWSAEARAAKAERAMALAREAEKAQRPQRDKPISPVGTIRGWVTYVRAEGQKRAIVEGVDDTGQGWRLDMNEGQYRGLCRRAAYLERQQQRHNPAAPVASQW
jgi:hypothetical protein